MQQERHHKIADETGPGIQKSNVRNVYFGGSRFSLALRIGEQTDKREQIWDSYNS